METAVACDFDQFIQSLFRNEAMPPYSFRLEFEHTEITRVLSSIITTGASIIYGKPVHELCTEEIQHIRIYMLSLGWDADYKMVPLSKEVLDYYPDGQPYIRILTINNWQITFKQADMPVQSCSHALS
jgi:hypothetical protein